MVGGLEPSGLLDSGLFCCEHTKSRKVTGYSNSKEEQQNVVHTYTS